jgi:hypothetical protein
MSVIYETDSIAHYLTCNDELYGLEQLHIDLAVKIGLNCDKLKIVSAYSSRSIAAAIILTVVVYKELKYFKKSLAKYFKTSYVSIYKIHVLIRKYLAALVDDDATDYLVKKHGL